MNTDLKRKVLGAIARDPNMAPSFYAERLGMNATDFTTYSQELMNSGFLFFGQSPDHPEPSIDVTATGKAFLEE